MRSLAARSLAVAGIAGQASAKADIVVTARGRMDGTSGFHLRYGWRYNLNHFYLTSRIRSSLLICLRFFYVAVTYLRILKQMTNDFQR